MLNRLIDLVRYLQPAAIEQRCIESRLRALKRELHELDEQRQYCDERETVLRGQIQRAMRDLSWSKP